MNGQPGSTSSVLWDVERRSSSGSKHQIMSALAAPNFQPTLQGAQQACGIVARIFSLKLGEQFAARSPRFGQEPGSQLRRDGDEWVGSTSFAFWFRLGLIGRPRLPVLPGNA